jgi:transposase
MMYALEPRVYDPVFDFIKHLIPPPPPHPLGCHRRRISDRIVFRGLLYRLITGASWQTIEFMLDRVVSDTTLRARRDEWIDAGIFTSLVAHAMNAYQQVIGYDLNDVFIDGCNNDAISSEGTGFNPKHPGKQGWKFVIAVDTAGAPISFTLNGANRQDYPMMFEVLDDLHARNKTTLIGTLHADRGFNYTSTPARLADDYGIDNFRAPPRNQPGQGRIKRCPSGPRWIVEATNAWLRNYGQIAHNTDRYHHHRHAALSLAIALFLVHRISSTKHSTWRPIR